jgi:hypothetical protein
MSTEQLPPLSPASAQSFLASLQASFNQPQPAYSFTDMVTVGDNVKIDTEQRPLAASGSGSNTRRSTGQDAAATAAMANSKDDHKRKNEFRERDPVDDSEFLSTRMASCTCVNRN